MGVKKKAKEKEMKANEEETVEGLALSKIGRGLYLCESRSGSEPYVVDIMAYNGLGGCDCMDFLTRRFPRWRNSKKLYDSFRCFHIRHVRQHVLDQIIAHYIKQEDR